jgi:molecular chaperone HtpG
VHLHEAGKPESEARAVNSATALWTRPRSEITDDEYKVFYKHISHDFSDPLAWSHNRVEGKKEYTSLLYVPERAPFDLWNRDAPRGLKLYVQRVFIMDQAEQFLPLYLRFVKGVVDSSDLPLNVSRELLQQNRELETIRSALTKRVLGMLGKLASAEPEKYATFWREFGQVLKEGIVEDPQNADKIAKLLRFASTHEDSDEQGQSLADYVARAEASQDRIYYLLAENYATAKASPHLEQLRKKGIEVLLLTDRIDAWIVDHLPEYEGKKLHDVGRGSLSLPEGEGELTQQAKNEEHKPLLKKMRKTLKDRVTEVNVSLRLVDSPACVITSADDLAPQLRRLLEATGQKLPESKPVLEINIEHPLVQRLSGETDEQRFQALSNVILDQALLAEGAALEDPAAYVRRVNELLVQ